MRIYRRNLSGRRDSIGRALRHPMSEEQLLLIQLGKADTWMPVNDDMVYTEENPVVYRVIGMPEGQSAIVNWAGPQNWQFSVDEQSGEYFESKEAAMEGLKEWLRVNR
jgi:hypothetical protein